METFTSAVNSETFTETKASLDRFDKFSSSQIAAYFKKYSVELEIKDETESVFHTPI